MLLLMADCGHLLQVLMTETVTGELQPGGVAGLRSDAVTRDAYDLVFELIRSKGEEIGEFLGFGQGSDKVRKLCTLRPDDVFVSLSPVEVSKFGRSMMGALFVGLVAMATGRKLKDLVVITAEFGMW